MFKVFLFLLVAVMAAFYSLLTLSLQKQLSSILSSQELAAIEKGIIDKIGFKSYGGELYCVYTILGHDECSTGTKVVYMLAETGEFVESGGTIREKSGALCPVVIKLRDQKLVSSETPRDGGYFGDDVRRLFPSHLLPDVFQMGEKGALLPQQLRAKVALIRKVESSAVKLASDG